VLLSALQTHSGAQVRLSLQATLHSPHCIPSLGGQKRVEKTPDRFGFLTGWGVVVLSRPNTTVVDVSLGRGACRGRAGNPILPVSDATCAPFGRAVFSI
jgi:hypothetical protein